MPADTDTPVAGLDLVDIGVNLADKSFRSDTDAVVERAFQAGVRRMILTGTSLARSRASLELTRSRPGVLWSTAGVHPHDAGSADSSTMQGLRELADSPEVVAIGECGLDFYRDLSPRPVQEEWFAAQLQLAAEVGLPAFVHDRDASARVAAIAREHRDRLVGAVVHCFTGDRAALEAYLDLDLHIGITGWICDERRGTGLRELVRLVPEDRLMIETDAPYLLPRTIRPKPKSRRNEPAHLTWVCAAVAACRGCPPERVARATTATAETFFALRG